MELALPPLPRPSNHLRQKSLICRLASWPSFLEGPVPRNPTGFFPSDARQSSRVVFVHFSIRFNDHLTPRQCRIRLSPVGGNRAPSLSPAVRSPRPARGWNCARPRESFLESEWRCL